MTERDSDRWLWGLRSPPHRTAYRTYVAYIHTTTQDKDTTETGIFQPHRQASLTSMHKWTFQVPTDVLCPSRDKRSPPSDTARHTILSDSILSSPHAQPRPSRLEPPIHASIRVAHRTYRQRVSPSTTPYPSRPPTRTPICSVTRPPALNPQRPSR